jgi:hypothetical protein
MPIRHVQARQVHHLSYRYIGQDHLYPRSLVSVCRPCHGLFEYARKADALLSNIRSRIARGCSNPVPACARLLEYRDELTTLRGKFDAEVPYANEVLRTDAERRNSREAFAKRERDYRETAMITTAAWIGNEAQKSQAVVELLRREAELCKDFLKAALGELYEWEQEYAETREQAYAKQQTTMKEAALKAQEAISKFDFTTQKSVGKCPNCGGKVFLREMGYLCEHWETGPNPCEFKVKLQILNRPIEPAEVSKLLARGRTDLLDKFTPSSCQTFSAYLIVESGKIKFELPVTDDKRASEK